MAESFRASFVLALKDELSGGLRRIIADTKQLRELAKGLGFKPLEGAGAIVNRVDRDVQQLNRDLGATARQAESAAGAVRRMGAAESGRATAQAAQQAAQLRNLRTIGLTLERQRSVAGQGFSMRGDAPFSGGTAGPSMLRLGGPGGGGSGGGGGGVVPYGSYEPPGGPIPLNIGPGFGTRAGGALRGAAGRLGAAANGVGTMGGMMAGLSLAAPIREAAEFDNVLTHIAITAGATEAQVRSKVAAMAETYRAMALSTKQSSHDVAESAQFLITTGIGERMTNELLPIIAKAATAYNTPIGASVQGAFAMSEALKIKPEDMRGALSATALAAKQGHFSFNDFSMYLPAIAAQVTRTMPGREGLNSLLAALETSRRGAGTSGQAATNLQDFNSYINAQIGEKSFAKAGINLPALKIAAEKAGQNPIEAVIEAVRRRTAGMSPARQADLLGKLFHNQEARIFAQTMLNELAYYQEVKAKVGGADQGTIDEDFAKAQNMHTRLVEMSETSHQLVQRVGLGFSWVVPVGTAMLGGVLGGLGWMDHHLPGVADGAIGLTGGMLGLVAVMGVLGTVMGPIKAGFALFKGLLAPLRIMLAPLRLVTSALGGAGLAFSALAVGAGAAAIYIWRHWDQFRGNFLGMWAGIKQSVGGFKEMLMGALTFDGGRISAGFRQAWAGVRQYMDALWGHGGIMENLMTAFVAWLPEWGKSFVTALGGVMQEAYAGWAKFFADIKAGMAGVMPSQPFMAPPGGPDSFPRYQSPSATPTTPGVGTGTGPAQRHPTAYQMPAGDGTPQRIHVTFEADVPGRASIRHGDAAPAARGPMLSRA